MATEQGHREKGRKQAEVWARVPAMIQDAGAEQAGARVAAEAGRPARATGVDADNENKTKTMKTTRKGDKLCH